MTLQKDGDPQLSWATVISMIGVVALLFGGSWAVFQTQFASMQVQINTDRGRVDNELRDLKNDVADVRRTFTPERQFAELRRQVDVIEVRVFELSSKAAHSPVESGELNALIQATDKRLDTVQSQIADINRQIAAAILLTDTGDAKKKALVPP